MLRIISFILSLFLSLATLSHASDLQPAFDAAGEKVEREGIRPAAGQAGNSAGTSWNCFDCMLCDCDTCEDTGGKDCNCNCDADCGDGAIIVPCLLIAVPIIAIGLPSYYCYKTHSQTRQFKLLLNEHSKHGIQSQRLEKLLCKLLKKGCHRHSLESLDTLLTDAVQLDQMYKIKKGKAKSLKKYRDLVDAIQNGTLERQIEYAKQHAKKNVEAIEPLTDCA